MGRLILNNTNTVSNTRLTVQSNTKAKTSITNLNPDSLLRKKRSSKYVETLKKLDSGNICLNNASKNELLEALSEEFGEIEPGLWPKGIVAKCYLGDDYEVHTLDVSLQIVKHFKRSESLPQGMDVARNIANNKNYAFIEVYSSILRVVSHEGTVSEINI
jgi:hypothetical protein